MFKSLPRKLHLISFLLAAALSAHAQQIVTLSVQVTDKSGAPAIGLEQKDFTLLDNKSPVTLTAFKAATAAEEQVHVVLVLDTSAYLTYYVVTYVRDEIAQYLRTHSLANPTTIAIVSAHDIKTDIDFSKDGNDLAGSLALETIGLRQDDYYDTRRKPAPTQLLQAELSSFRKLLAYSARIPGRKILIWFSPGWPLLTDTREGLTEWEKEHIFHEFVDLNTQMRDANVTLYNINPIVDQFLAGQYREFLGGISKPYQVEAAALSLQVQTTHSGGLVLTTPTSVGSLLGICLQDADSWYELSFQLPVARTPDEYHQLKVKLDQRGLTARTRDSYYIQPPSAATHGKPTAP